MTTEEFVDRARARHGDRFDYSRVEYTGSRHRVEIHCDIHGPFWQNATNHLRGYGCPACSLERRAETYALSTGEFIGRARAVHGDSYEYSRVGYVDAATPVEIVCPIHNSVFLQAPKSHLSGAGCPPCAHERQSRENTSTTDEFIARAEARHGDRYDYSRAVYTRSAEPVEIVCRAHGPFIQIANNHLNGNGCPGCKESRGEAAVRAVLERYDVKFSSEWTPGGTGKERRYRFDFAIPDQRVLVEFDGLHHRQPVRWSSSMTQDEADANLVSTQRRDAIKTAWAAANGWTLFRLTDVATVEEDLVAAGVVPAIPPVSACSEA